MNKRTLVALLTVVSLTVALAACGGGGGGGSTPPPATQGTVALTVTDRVSVVDAQPQLSSSIATRPLLMGIFQVTAADLAGTDYEKDKTQVWVSERSAETFGIVNEILCMIGQTRYDVMMNQNDYIALIDMNTCSSDKADASSAGSESQNQSSSATMPQYESWTVNSSRANNDSDHIVKAWIHEKARPEHQDVEKIIYAKVSIQEAKSDTNPYGMFTIDFRAFPATDGVQQGTSPLFKGYLKTEKDPATGAILLKLASQDTQPSHSGTQQITLNRSADGSSGSGTVQESGSGTDDNGFAWTHELAFDIAYNAANFYRQGTLADNGSSSTQTVCLNRTSFDESAWRYGLYKADGSRLNRNSGFSINTSQDGTGAHGWVGYWGLWIDNNGTISNNATVYKYEYGPGGATPTPYTVFLSDGKLKKHSRKMLTLADVKGIPLEYGEWDSVTQTGTQFRVVWNGTVFNKVAQMPNCTGNCTWQNMTETPIDIAHLQWNELNFWSQSLGGQTRVKLGSASTPCTFVSSTTGPGWTDCSATPPVNTTPVVFYKEDLVYPGDAAVPASLMCYDNCPQVSSAAGIDIDSNGNYAYYPSWNPQTGQSQSHTYTYDSNSMSLKDGAYSVITTTTTQQNQWGVNTGALIDAATPNLASLLDCNWDNDNDPATQPQTCGWKAWSELPVFYTWETGPNNWNKFTGLIDPATGAFLTFEAPLQVKYVHHKLNSPVDGATFMMEYNGFGNLNGIPGKCVDLDTGAEADCSMSNGSSSIRWVPAFTIPMTQADGSLTTVRDETAGADYFVKPLEMEQRMMKEPDLTTCSSVLTLQSYVLPPLTFSDPAIGAEPNVTTAPAVIGGVVQ